ncbi:FtsX-like permease family protein [Microbacterium sp.]|uniref:FtsX-like permease family protein n=1 Tax=Microbacterium sp. TaxID=51671 RepID=UPI003F6F6109
MTGASAGVVGLLSSSATVGVRGVLEATPRYDLSLGLTMPLASDPEEQARVTEETFRASFRNGTRAIPLSIEQSVQTVLDVTLDDATERRVIVVSASRLDSDADLVTGRWADDPSEATLQADAASALGLALGDTLSMQDARVTLVGTWRVSDAEAPRWLGEEQWTTGASGDSAGPLVIDRSLWSALDAKPWVQWAIIPDTGRLQATDLAAIAHAWEQVPDAIRAAGLETGSRSGQFVTSTRELGVRLAALQTAIPLALVILSVIAALTIWELAGLTARTRATEMALLWSRGATTASLSVRAGLEAAAITAIGSALGIGVAALVLWSVQGSEAVASTLWAGLWAAAAAVAAGALAFSLRTIRTARAPRAAERAGRARSFAGVGGVVLLLVAAALSTWQLRTYGPVTGRASGEPSVDPVTVVAPALILASVVLLGLYLFPALVAAAERGAVRGTGRALAVRGVSRRIGAAAATIVMLGLAVGQLVVAAGYSATWSESFTQAQQLRSGSALRLQAPPGGMTAADLDTAAGAASVVGLAPVRTQSVTIGSEQAGLVGSTPAAIAELAEDGRDLIDTAALSEAIVAQTELPQLPGEATNVTIDVGTSPAEARSVWLVDAWGRLDEVPLSPAADQVGVASATLPLGRAPWRLVAIDVVPLDGVAPTTVAVRSVTTDAGAVSPVPVIQVAFRENGTPFLRSELGPGGVPEEAGAVLRLLSRADDGLIAISERLAERIDAEVGSAVTVRISSSAPPVSAVVTAIVPVIPGASGSSGLLVDTAVVDLALLTSAADPRMPSTVWVGSDDAAASASALRELMPSSVAVDELGAEPDLPMLTAGAGALWIAAAAGGALAIAGLIVVCAAQQRERRNEIGVLRALGLAAGQQAGVRRGELAIISAWGAVCGAAAGLVALLVVVGTLARAAIPGVYASIPTPPRFDVVVGVGALVALALAVAAVITLAGTTAGRAARTLTVQQVDE